MELVHSASGGVVSKSCTRLPREGNAKPRYYHNDFMSINSTGLANLGYEFYAQFAQVLASDERKCKPYIVSVVLLERDDMEPILRTLDAARHVALIELNLSCPNVTGKPQTGYDTEATDRLLERVFAMRLTTPVGVKLPPYFDPVHFDAMSDVLRKHNVAFLTCINSLGNGLVLNDVMDPVIAPNSGLGGVGGAAILPFGLSNVFNFSKRLPLIPIIGCGGVTCARDVQRYLHAGASLVQIGTQLVREGPDVFKRLLSQ